jgi:N-acetylglucosamine kinase-like BadF-type ATPase
VPFFLGIDGGGTKTRCIIGDEIKTLGAGSGSGCNIVRVGEACARDSLASAIHEACVSAGVAPQKIVRTCAGVAGAADDGVASLVQRVLIEILGGAIEVIGDMEIALESAFGAGAGVVVIAGTGAIAYGRNLRGESARAGGWGRLVSDEGSGHWIGEKAIGAALREFDGGKESVLLDALMKALEVRSVHDLAVSANSDPIPEFAALFPVVMACANAGDPASRGVLQEAGTKLAETAVIVFRRLFAASEAAQVATHGGVFERSEIVREAFFSELLRVLPQAERSDAIVDPAWGALQRARREYGVWHKQEAQD